MFNLSFISKVPTTTKTLNGVNKKPHLYSATRVAIKGGGVSGGVRGVVNNATSEQHPSTTTTTKYGGLVEEKGATTKKFQDQMCQHKSIITLGPSKKPKFNKQVFIAPSAVFSGNITLLDFSSVWYGSIIRADSNAISIGQWTNIQDETIVTSAFGPLGPDHDGSTIIGHYVTIGHKCSLRACTIEDECLVGMGSILEEGSYMETQSMLGAGSVLTKGSRIQTGELWLGNPAKFYRKLTDEEKEQLQFAAKDYYTIARNLHMKEFFVPSTLHRDAEKLGFKIGWQEPRP